jgi:hypothetical protein
MTGTIVRRVGTRQCRPEPILRYTRTYGRDALVIQQYAGVIRTESGCQIEILPKIS